MSFPGTKHFCILWGIALWVFSHKTDIPTTPAPWHQGMHLGCGVHWQWMERPGQAPIRICERWAVLSNPDLFKVSRYSLLLLKKYHYTFFVCVCAFLLKISRDDSSKPIPASSLNSATGRGSWAMGHWCSFVEGHRASQGPGLCVVVIPASSSYTFYITGPQDA